MINHYRSLTMEERILLHEIVLRNKKSTMDIDMDILPIMKQNVVVTYIKTAIERQLKDGEGMETAKAILKKIEG